MNNDLPELDLNLLGMGPDGHTASLFPGHPLLSLDDPSVWVSYLNDSPKPPPSRITLTLQTINNAKHNMIVLSGEGKADLVSSIFKGGD